MKTDIEYRLEASEQVCKDMRAFIDEKGLTEEWFTWFNTLMQGVLDKQYYEEYGRYPNE